jgi:hypothetical protein
MQDGQQPSVSLTDVAAAAASTVWQPSGVSPKQLREYQATIDEVIAARAAREVERKALADYLARKDLRYNAIILCTC